jgi:hypothetical protein
LSINLWRFHKTHNSRLFIIGNSSTSSLFLSLCALGVLCG